MKFNQEHMLQSYFFDHDDDIDIHQPLPSSCCHELRLKIFRIVGWFLLTIVYFWQVAISRSLFIEIKYLTLHGVFLAWLYFSLICLDAFFNRTGSERPKIICEGLKYWTTLIYQSSLCFGVPITLIYWLLLFKHDLKRLKTEMVILAIMQHSIPILLLVLDFFFNKFKFKITRLILILLHGVGYLVINILYTRSARPIYPIMKWNNAASTIYALSACALMIISFLAFRLINRYCKGREYKSVECREDREHRELEEEADG